MVEQSDRRRAESVLEHRAKRVEKFHIRSLSTEERSRFAEARKREQARFVDDPRVAVGNADRLVGEVMRTRGYPMAEFEQRAADISVDHPQVGRELSCRQRHNSRGDTRTEDLRQAMVYYRSLFVELLEEPVLEPQEVRR